MIRIAMIGLSEGNGHPYSFSAILNGYNDEGMAASPYPVIYDYLKKRRREEFGIADAKVTHVWTPESKDAESIARAARIPNIAADLSTLPDLVDAAIIARDDADSHWPIAQLFLNHGIPVFVDKPLATTSSDLEAFEPFLRNGSLMSCSAMRYAVEFDSVRSSFDQLGEIRSAHAICMNDWLRYGIHIVEGMYGVIGAGAVSVCNVGAPDGNIVRARWNCDLQLVFQVVERMAPTFQVQFFGTEAIATVVVRDFFSMFRRALVEFVGMVQTGNPSIPPDETMEIIRLLIAAKLSLAEGGREVALSEIR